MANISAGSAFGDGSGDFASIDARIDALLAAHPSPHVIAASEAGFAVPVPPAVPIAEAYQITGVSTLLELCVASDMGDVVAAWQQVRVARYAHAMVHLRSDPAEALSLTFIDARHRYGVYLGILNGARGPISANRARPAILRPRLFTLERNEVAVTCRIDRVVEEILGWDPGALVGAPTTDLVHPDDRDLSIATWMEMLKRPGCDQRTMLRYRHRDGRYLWFEVTNRNLLADPVHPHVFTEFIDVSERMEAVEQLRASEELLRRLTETLPQGIAQIDANRAIVYRNERLLEIFGLVRAERLDDVLGAVVGVDRAHLEQAIDALWRQGLPVDTNVTIVAGASLARCAISMRALKSDDDVNGVILSLTDVTEREILQAELERRARFDELTGCYNRSAALEILEQLVCSGSASPGGLAVLFIDLDRFKHVNDQFGHAIGDGLLRCVGERLLAEVRDGDYVGRLGGDEFLIISPHVDDPETARALAHRIAASLRQPARIGERTIAPGASIGIAWNVIPCDADALVGRADAAMYEAKRGGRSVSMSGEMPQPSTVAR